MSTSHYLVRPARGFTLLLAVLVSGVLLTLGLSIFNIASKQVLLSSFGRESQLAFYGADSGVECALYWDFQGNAFATTSTVTSVACGEGTQPVPPNPGGGSASLTRDDTGLPNVRVTTFDFSLGTGLISPCAHLTVTKSYNPVTSSLSTTLESRGYNTCVTTNPRRTERAIRVQY